jgi:hypothetical protein
MGRSFGIINMMVIVYFAALILGYLIYNQKENNEIEQLKLSYAIDYAGDAGAMQLLNTGRLDMDYTENKAFNINPQLALDAFIDVFCFNYDMPPTPYNRALVQGFIPVAVVAGFDGYYVASHRQVHYYKPGATAEERDQFGEDWQLVFDLKKPYRYQTTLARYALNMGLDYSMRLTGSGFDRYEGLPPDETGNTMSRPYAMKWINDLVANEMSAVINRANASNYNWKNRFYLPSQLTNRTGVNPIEGPSFIVLVQGVNLTTSKPIDGFSVSGTKIDQARMLVGYERNGVKYYAYADRVPNGAVTPERLFSTMKEAAQAGYRFDRIYMTPDPSPQGGG